MQKAKPQQKNVQNQPAARTGGGMAFASPQGEQIAQLEAMIESSPQMEKLGGLAAKINDSPAAAAQRKFADMIYTSPRQAAQRKYLNSIAEQRTIPGSMFGTAQRSEANEPLHGKLEPVQRIEDGVSLPGSFAQQPAQLEQQPAPKPNQTGLPDNLKSGIENLSGISMDNVRVHYNSSQPAQLNALAYAQGTNIHIAPGQEKHLPHEAWHVVQQAQGRVQPTMQMKDGVPVNEDQGLEHEADVMGGIAALNGVVQAKPMASAIIGFSGRTTDVVQGIFKVLDEERINHIINKAKEQKGEDLEADYLEGFFEKEDDKNDNADDPELFFQVGKVQKKYLTGDRNDTNQVRIFANAKTVELAEKKEKDEASEINGRNLLQVLAADTTLYTLYEGGPYTLADVKHNVINIIGEEDIDAEEHGRSEQERLIGNILEGGDYEGNPDSYGNIEFRFAKANGRLLISEEAEDNPILNRILDRNDKIEKVVMKKELLDIFQKVYMQSNFPHREERAGASFLFVAEHLTDVFMGAVRSYQTYGKKIDATAKMTVTDPDKDILPPTAPLNANKNREKSYQSRAIKGSRMGGQAAAMGGWSATAYAKYFNPAADKYKSWEWLHVQGARLGGPNVATNLVAGTSEANSAMIPYERAVYNLSKTATALKPVNITWTATLKRDDQHVLTHIGDKIGISVSFPHGAPPKRDGIDPVETAKPFPVEFNALEGAPVTKFDRDITEARTGKDL